LQKTDLSEILQETLRLVEARAHEGKVELVCQVPRKLKADVDTRAVKQILINLTSNAVKFTPEGGRVTLSVKLDGEHAVISIADTGIGIPPKDIEKLGRPFEQVENQFTKTKGGSGLGLAISKSLVELHGGTLSINSEIGKGTIVTVKLPAVAAKTAHSAAA
jgi:two-component system cell cycle sensor histidine kinase PleC